MTDAQVLLTKIAALRQQLEQAQGLAKDAGSSAASLAKDKAASEHAVRCLEEKVAEGSKQTVLLHRALRQVESAWPGHDTPILPKQLTARARRILEHGRELLIQLRNLADEFEPLQRPDGNETDVRVEWRKDRDDDPLAQRYQQTSAMANAALRMIQAFPDAASAQLPLCEGLENMLEVVAERVAEITAVLEGRGREAVQVESLASLLTALHAKKRLDIQSFVPLAEALLAEAQHGARLRFLDAQPEQPAYFVACHSLTVAQVVARVVRHDPDFRRQPLEPVLAALLYDAGMLSVPALILAQTGPLDDVQRRTLEGHTRLGAELMTGLLPDASWLEEAALGHHERLDGTGYPAGRTEAQLTPLTRLIAVCDVYAALCANRPHRPAFDTRTALADTLLLAEQGALDRYHAERLLQLSFYPVGSVVELADGASAVVVATHMGRYDLRSPARPVLALLTDTQGKFLSVPVHVDLAECENLSIVRTIPQAERGRLLGSRYPSLF
jgi:HD-GYP domain-containing protein (c-di-GMP phosphodiesterase class II)